MKNGLIKFYDTSSLLHNENNLPEDMVISSITLDELENIKTSSNKDYEIKYEARCLLRWINEHLDKIIIINFKEKMLRPILKQDLSITNDTKILACALSYQKQLGQEFCFVTNDLALKVIAKIFFKNVQSIEENNDEEEYTGYKEITLNDVEMSNFYSNLYQNTYNLLNNEYLLIKDKHGDIVDKLYWTGQEYKTISFRNFDSQRFGKVKPIKNDPYQCLAMDSLSRNKITMLKGPAGSGKTYLSLGYLLSQLEKGKIDKILVFCNTIATKNSAKLGFYPGSRDEKLLDSQIGNLLSSKLGGKFEVERMIAENQLVLLPLSDIRGYDTSGMRAGIYISEAQNLDISLMKLALQRIGEDCVCIIDGDCKTQVDDINFAGNNNGMRRASKIFRGENIYGEIDLKNIYRSRIAQIAERM